MDEYRHQNGRDIHLLDEFESWDCRELIQKCFQYHEIHEPREWIGDGDHGAVKNTLYAMNQGRRRRRNDVYFVTPMIIQDAYDQPYLYMLPEIKRLRDSEHRQLYFNDDSQVIRYMAEIRPDEMAELLLGAYPAIEALAFAVIEIRHWEQQEYEALRRPRRAPARNWNPLLY